MTVAGRVGTAMVGALVAGIGVATAVGWIASEPGGAEGETYSALMIIMGTAGAWLFAFRPRVYLDRTNVTVVNPLRTTVVPLDRVQPTSRAGYAGLVIVYFEAGRIQRVSAWAIQKWNLAVWLNRQTRADRIGQEIADAAARAQQGKA